ncbi:MAG: hypothetical protein QF363_06245 [Planctomycetaceae bacterium]|jgi:hypothetical protein|nr:hypothetical protein [Planctomycetaceae bacterium]
MRISRDQFSPGVKTKVVIVAAETKSYARAAVVLEKVGEVRVSDRHIGRVAQVNGQRLVDQLHEQAELLKQKKLSIEVENIPELAVVEFDGGRIRTRQEDQGSGTHDPRWRETKNALFMRMQSDIHAEDPCPVLPQSLQNRNRIRQLVLEMSGTAEGVEESPDEETLAESQTRYQGPKRLFRTCISSLANSREFGPLMTAEAHRRGLFQASRQAFVADGMKCNWTTQKKHFPAFTPIVDFLHVISYLYHAALAIGEDEDFGWGLCLQWTSDCWQGRVGDVIVELADWLSRQKPLAGDEDRTEDDPRVIVATAVTYLTNNQSRMQYPEYRRQGLPLTSSLMESLVKEINWRVKGTEKFWNDPSGANAILALRAASLCEDGRLEQLLTE